jgi:hypothetical protein
VAHIKLRLTSLLIAALSSSASAQDGNPAFWLLMPFAGQIAQCAKHGPDMRSRLDEALRTARENAPKLLPPTAWEVIRMGLSGSEGATAGEPVAAASCEETIAAYRHPQFSTHLRQLLAVQFAGSVALQCIVQQPSTGTAIKRAWLNAFSRNGFDLSEARIDETAKAANEHLKSTGAQPPLLEECQRVATEVFGEEFDGQYSEQGVYRLFSGERK